MKHFLALSSLCLFACFIGFSPAQAEDGIAARITKLKESLASIEREETAAKKSDDAPAAELLSAIRRNLETTIFDLERNGTPRIAMLVKRVGQEPAKDVHFLDNNGKRILMVASGTESQAKGRAKKDKKADKNKRVVMVRVAPVHPKKKNGTQGKQIQEEHRIIVLEADVDLAFPGQPDAPKAMLLRGQKHKKKAAHEGRAKKHAAKGKHHSPHKKPHHAKGHHIKGHHGRPPHPGKHHAHHPGHDKGHDGHSHAKGTIHDLGKMHHKGHHPRFGQHHPSMKSGHSLKGRLPGHPPKGFHGPMHFDMRMRGMPHGKPGHGKMPHGFDSKTMHLHAAMMHLHAAGYEGMAKKLHDEVVRTKKKDKPRDARRTRDGKHHGSKFDGNFFHGPMGPHGLQDRSGHHGSMNKGAAKTGSVKLEVLQREVRRLRADVDAMKRQLREHHAKGDDTAARKDEAVRKMARELRKRHEKVQQQFKNQKELRERTKAARMQAPKGTKASRNRKAKSTTPQRNGRTKS